MRVVSAVRPQDAPIAGARALGHPERLIALAASLAFAIAWTLALGKDVHWDAVNYHLYAGYSALVDRFGQDFFAAGPPSYLNPYAYVPLYLMNSAGWSGLAIATALASWHALPLWLTYEIASVAAVRDERLAPDRFALLAVLLAAINPIYLQGVGSTLTDVSTAVPVLAAWLAIALAVRDGSIRPIVVAGALSGAAAALKLSNAVFAIAGFIAIAFVPGRLGFRAWALAVFGAACAAGFALVALPWSLRLWSEFGNPLFPFLNQYFASPDFTAAALRYERFIPPDARSFLLRPFEMLSASSVVHTEPRAPDLRYAALIVALLAWALAMSTRRGARVTEHARGTLREQSDRTSLRVLASLGTGFVVAWCLWLAISGNSRYFVPMACIASVLLALVLQRLNALWHTATISAIIAMLFVQGVQFALGTDWKRDGGEWDGPWMRVEVPERLRNERQLYLSVGFLTGSAMLPYVHPRSGMINVSGFNVIAPGHPGAERALAMIAENADRLRMLAPLPAGVVDRATLPGPPEELNVYVRRLGVRVDGSDCEFLRIEGNLRGERRPDDGRWKHFIACRLVLAPEQRAAYESAVRAVDPVFDRVEDTCPNLFHPRRPPTQEYMFLARTYHMGSEMQLYVDGDRVKYFFPLRGGDPIDIGSIEAWKAAPQPFDCSRKTAPAFGLREP